MSRCRCAGLGLLLILGTSFDHRWSGFGGIAAGNGAGPRWRFWPSAWRFTGCVELIEPLARLEDRCPRCVPGSWATLSLNDTGVPAGDGSDLDSLNEELSDSV